MTTIPATIEHPQQSPSLLEYEDPMLVVARQSGMAKALARVIEQQGAIPNPFVSKISGKDYLTYESWQLITRFNNAHVELDEARGVEPVEENGQVVAYQATVNVIDNATGLKLGRATMECGMNSFPTQGKTGREKVKAAQSAAQTWAASKACRMAFSGIAVLAGYQPATAEEMGAAPATSAGTGSSDANAPEEGDSGVECPQHQGMTFFRTGRMKGYAHKDDQGEWCNFKPSMFSHTVAAAAQAADMTNDVLAVKTKEWFGRTWSNLNPMQVLDLLSKLYELADERASNGAKAAQDGAQDASEGGGGTEGQADGAQAPVEGGE